jgi:AcrR family transcriptional regulator
MADTVKKKRTRRIRETVREETRAAYRQAILDAAAKTFGRLGFHEAKMADIAAEAGVAAGTLYNYFDSKDEIFASMLQQAQERFIEMIQAVSEDEPDPLQRVLAFLQTSYAFLEEGGPLFAIYLRQGGLAEWSRQRLQESDDRLFKHYTALLEETFAEAIDAGLLREDVSPPDLAAMLAGLSDAQVFSWVRRGCPADLIARASLVFDIFLNGATKR